MSNGSHGFRADVAIIGGGPAGLSAALLLGRGRKRVLVYDAGAPRNAAAERLHSFVTRDGTPPAEFRRIARAQLAPYDVAFRQAWVRDITRAGDLFRIDAEGAEPVTVRQVLLANGMVDLPPALPGYRELWGHAVFQCPYCHGWEHRDERWALHAHLPMQLEFALLLTGWTKDLIVFVDPGLEVPEERARQLERAGIVLERRAIAGLIPNERTEEGERSRLAAVELSDGTRIARDVLFAHPPQRQVDLVQRLGLELAEGGYVKATPQGATSVPGIFAAGDLTTPVQGALFAAAAGSAAGGAMNHALNVHAAT